MFSRVLSSLVATYVEGEGAIQAEIDDLKEVLIRFGAEPCGADGCANSKADAARSSEVPHDPESA
jgi:hypothetical protein